MDPEWLLEEPEHRRGWLLTKALECAPLDRAIELARAAENFIVGKNTPGADRRTGFPATSDLQSAAMVGPDRIEAAGGPEPDPVPGMHPSGMILTSNRRHELLDRAAKGETNAALATEFGLTRRQVQAIRMGAARMDKQRSTDTPRAPEPVVSATADEVVRYLRQRDDVVVPNGEDAFLVNGRFRMGLAELVAKANRARARQNKPLFEVSGVCPEAEPDLERNGQPVSWALGAG
jgi:hypothetical protein